MGRNHSNLGFYDLCTLSSLLVNSLLFCSGADGGQVCATCTGVLPGKGCHDNSTCTHHEVRQPRDSELFGKDRKMVCHMTEYSNEAGQVVHDYGCASLEACPHFTTSGFLGRRRSYSVHHYRCHVCCNDVPLCNDGLACSVPNPTATYNGLPIECSDLSRSSTENGTYTIYPFGTTLLPVAVYCMFDNAGHIWTVIQRRFNGSVDFYRTWQDYKQGFGSPNGEYWLGNDIIHRLTSYANHSLRVVMSDFDNVTKEALYSSFRVGNERSGYILHVEGYSGTAGNSLTPSNGYRFTTLDRDNDLRNHSNCAQFLGGAWWYGNCGAAHLNGQYLVGHQALDYRGIVWRHWKGPHYSLKTTTMMIRLERN